MLKKVMSGIPLVVWGNGGFGPTSRGHASAHASAPNKCLRQKLSQYLPIVTETEYRTTQLSCCHHMKTVRCNKAGRKRDTVKRCVMCNTLLGRDTNATHNIADIFHHRNTTGEVPEWLKLGFPQNKKKQYGRQISDARLCTQS